MGVFALIVGSALFCLVLAIFYGIGTLVGESLQAAGPPLQAYTLNLAGSLVGTLAFTALVFVFVAAVGVDSARIFRAGLLLLQAHPRRTDFRKRPGDNCGDGDPQPRSVVALLPYYLRSQAIRIRRFTDRAFRSCLPCVWSFFSTAVKALTFSYRGHATEALPEPATVSQAAE